jgi:hypothetical protein
MATPLPLPVKMDVKPITCYARDILRHKLSKMPLSSNLKLRNCPFKQNKRTELYIPRLPLIIVLTKTSASRVLACPKREHLDEVSSTERGSVWTIPASQVEKIRKELMELIEKSKINSSSAFHVVVFVIGLLCCFQRLLACLSLLFHVLMCRNAMYLR